MPYPTSASPRRTWATCTEVRPLVPWSGREAPTKKLAAKTNVRETDHPARKAKALTRALAVPRRTMNTTMVLGERLARSPRRRIGTNRLTDGHPPPGTSRGAGWTRRLATAQARKHPAPPAVVQFAAARSSTEPDEGTTYPATAATPKSTQPRRLTPGCHQPSEPRTGSQPCRAEAWYATRPETRKQIEPNASG